MEPRKKRKKNEPRTCPECGAGFYGTSDEDCTRCQIAAADAERREAWKKKQAEKAANGPKLDVSSWVTDGMSPMEAMER